MTYFELLIHIWGVKSIISDGQSCSNSNTIVKIIVFVFLQNYHVSVTFLLNSHQTTMIFLLKLKYHHCNQKHYSIGFQY